MRDIEEILQMVADMENTIFEDGWSVEALKSSLNYDYNYILLAFICDEDIKLIRLKGYDGDYKKTTYNICEGSNLSDGYAFAGYLTYSTIQSESELLRIATKSEFRKKGIGTKLIKEYIEDISKTSCEGFLEVRENNFEARKLYEKIGYKQVGVRKNYYKNPLEDGVIYQITFSK